MAHATMAELRKAIRERDEAMAEVERLKLAEAYGEARAARAAKGLCECACPDNDDDGAAELAAERAAWKAWEAEKRGGKGQT